ncbi:MAG: FadR/GntR family transcriptional regulator [Planctomycetota bacterium]|nr:FadR/GntR family transcriptional regulator [Planctomycetota bacterium]
MDVHAKTNISDRIADALLERIMADGLGAGQVLPSERELMHEFGVSRLACREALAKLRGMGIIQARHGKGAFLADLDNSSLTPAILKLLRVHGHICSADVIDARLIIEPKAASLAARNANSAQRKGILNQVRDDLHNFEDSPIVQRARRFGEIDLSFHQSIAAASGNPILPMLLKSMHELLLRIRLEALILNPDIASRALADHKKIALAIGARDAQAAEKAMKSHIRLRGKDLLENKK